MGKKSDDIVVGCLVRLNQDSQAIGYPATQDLGIGLVMEDGANEFADSRYGMVKVFWNKTKSKRWEFVEDLEVIEHTY